ncbi:hypothetical protein [Gaiella sp.]|uniref:hypothetical protein n=1 Tax=Gaiella sp. TaxID=2663207 RepID=UPI0032650A1F
MPRQESHPTTAMYAQMVDALAKRDLNLLVELLAEDVEVRSYATAGQLVVGRANVIAAIEANSHLVFDPVLLKSDHLGDGWMIVGGRLRHSLPTGGIADSEKTILACVVDQKVTVSLVFRTAAEARAEHRNRIAHLEEVP